ncbi:hypothetical protein FB446DRAFT_388813 [Lentinula raphanica]|nr:hypothetical protein FB446DRAFT_388813 [Lentinula raphanica]
MRLNPVQAILCFVFTVHALPAEFGDLSSLLDDTSNANQAQAGQVTRLGGAQLPSLLNSAPVQERPQATHAGKWTDRFMRLPFVNLKTLTQLERLPPPPDISAAELESPSDGIIHYQVFSKDQVMKVSNEKERDILMKLLLASDPKLQFDKSKMTNFIQGGLSLFGQKFVEMPVRDPEGLKDDAFAIQVDSKFVVQKGTTCPCQVHFRDSSGRKSAVFVPYGEKGVDLKHAHTVHVD